MKCRMCGKEFELTEKDTQYCEECKTPEGNKKWLLEKKFNFFKIEKWDSEKGLLPL